MDTSCVYVVGEPSYFYHRRFFTVNLSIFNHPHSRWFICFTHSIFRNTKNSTHKTGPCPNKKWQAAKDLATCQLMNLILFFVFLSVLQTRIYRLTSIPYLFVNTQYIRIPSFVRHLLLDETFFPISVREYSTLGGIDSYCFRSTNPLSTSAFN